MPRRGPSAESEAPGEAAGRRMRELVEGLRDAFASLDSRWRITDCNTAAEAILGEPRERLLGRTIWQVVGVPRDSELGDAARRVRATGRPEEAEVTVHLAGGRKLLSVRAFRFDGGLGVVAGDITEIRAAEARLAESEARFRELAQGAPAATWMSNARGELEYVNPAMLKAFDRGEDEVLGDGWQRICHPEDLEALRHAQRVGREQHTGFQITARFQSRDGAWRVLQLNAVPRFDPSGAFRGNVGMAIDVTDLIAAQKRQEMLINELNHRVKNTLATVQSLVRQTLRESDVSKEIQGLLTERVMALSAAHNVLTREHWEGAELSEIAREAVRAFDPEGGRISVAGPKARLAPNIALALALALNELATNAVRHGALSAPEGRARLAWTRTDDAVAMEWRETGGPTVRAPVRRGFGSRLLGHGLAGELGHPAEITYAPEGLVCRIVAPIESNHVADHRPSPTPVRTAPQPPSAPPP